MKRTRESYMKELRTMSNKDLESECKRQHIPHSGTKSVKIDRLIVNNNKSIRSCREVAEEIKAKTAMDFEEFLGYYAYLGPDQSKWDFPIAIELGIFLGRGNVVDFKGKGNVNNYTKIWQQLKTFKKEWFHKCSRKERVQTYDLSFHSFLDKLVQKGAEHWTLEDSQEIIEKFGDVYKVDCKGEGNNISALRTYSRFQKELVKRYSIDSKLKYYLDPHVVVVDLPETHAAAILAAISAFVPNPSLAALPMKDNNSITPFAWSFATDEEAFWWMGFLKGRIPLVNLIYYETNAAALNYN